MCKGLPPTKPNIKQLPPSGIFGIILDNSSIVDTSFEVARAYAPST